MLIRNLRALNTLKNGVEKWNYLTHRFTKFYSNNKKFLTPKEFIIETEKKKKKSEVFNNLLLSGEFKFNPIYLTENKCNKKTNRPIPINVESLKYRPFILDKTHNDEIAIIKFFGYEKEDLERATEFAVRCAFYLGIPTTPIINHKTKKKLYTVIKSPFAQAKTKENFHRTTFIKEIRAYDCDNEVLDVWFSYLNKYAIIGVKYSVQINTFEPLNFIENLDNITQNEVKFPEAYQNFSNPVIKKVSELLESEDFKSLIEKKK